MKANRLSSSDHPGMSGRGRVSDDSSSDDYSTRRSDMDYGVGVCDDAAEQRRSSLLDFERMSPQHSLEFEYAAPNQPVPADIPIFPRYATIPTRGYARFADVSNSEGKFNLHPLTALDVTRGTHSSNVHQCDTIGDTAHEYDTLRGEKCHHKLLEAEERLVPSVEVNSRPSPLRNDDDGCRLVPQGRTHIDDSIKALQSPEADRYDDMTLSCDINEPLTLNDINEKPTLDGNNELLTLSDIDEKLHKSLTLSGINEKVRNNESLTLSDNNKELTLGGNNESLALALCGINETVTLSDNESLTLNFNESTTMNGLKFLTLCRNKTLVMQKSDTSESLTLSSNNNSLLLSGFNESLSLCNINESLREYFSSNQSKRRSNMVDVSVQTEPLEAPPVDITRKRFDHIDVPLKRRIENECDEQVPTSAGLDDTCQLVATAVRMIAPDGFPGAASGDGEGIDLPSPLFKWNAGKRPRSEAPAATRASLASNKRTRLRLGLSKRARPPPLHTTTKDPNGL